MMRRISEITKQQICVLLLFVGISLAAYGDLLTHAGLFGDDPQLLYAFHRYGLAGYQRALGWSRPFGIWIYAILFPLIGEHVFLWQLCALLLRTLSTWLLYRLLCETRREWRLPAIWAGLACLLYPGFSQQAHALQFILHWAALSAGLASQILMLKAVKMEAGSVTQRQAQGAPPQKKYLIPYLLSILLAGLGIFSTEYFIGLEVLRPFLLWLAFKQVNRNKVPIAALVKKWLPYIGLVLVFAIWRLFLAEIIYPQPLLLQELANDAQSALAGLWARIPTDIWKSSGLAWAQIFPSNERLTLLGNPSNRVHLDFWMNLCVGLVIALLPWTALRQVNKDQPQGRLNTSIVFLGLGLVLLFAGGVPLWISKTPLALSFPENRATLCLMTGACLWLAGLVHLLPARAGVAVISIILGLAAAYQINISRDYKRAREMMGDFLQQLSTCAPGLEEGTAILYEEPFIPSYPANSLAAFLNWTYSPDEKDESLSYDMLRVSERLGNAIPALEAGLPIRHGCFSGSTSHVLVVALDENGCLHILKAYEKPEMDIPPIIQAARRLSNPDVIVMSAAQAKPPEFIEGGRQEPVCACD
jgi:hypothetical protein